MPPPLGELGRRGELGEEAPGLGVALAVPDHLGIRHLRLRLLEPGLDLLDELLDHGPLSLEFESVIAGRRRADSGA